MCADARFPNERQAIKKAGGVNALVIRPNFVIETNHSSENLLGDEKDYDVIIMNDRSREVMEEDIESWWFVRSNRHGRV